MEKSHQEWLRCLFEQLYERIYQISTTDERQVVEISKELAIVIAQRLAKIADRIDYLERRCL